MAESRPGHAAAAKGGPAGTGLRLPSPLPATVPVSLPDHAAAPRPISPRGIRTAGQQPGYGYGTIPNIPSYMGWAIVTLILCFWPTGIVAVVYASKVGNRLALGDVPGAQEASRKAKMWTWITFGIGVAGVVLAIIIGVLVAALGTASITG